jgi:hypothetical protein
MFFLYFFIESHNYCWPSSIHNLLLILTTVIMMCAFSPLLLVFVIFARNNFFYRAIIIYLPLTVVVHLFLLHLSLCQHQPFSPFVFFVAVHQFFSFEKLVTKLFLFGRTAENMGYSVFFELFNHFLVFFDFIKSLELIFFFLIGHFSMCIGSIPRSFQRL